MSTVNGRQISPILTVLGGSWDLVTIYNWVITLLIIGVTPIRPFRGGYK